jgi:hypothetical protein
MVATAVLLLVKLKAPVLLEIGSPMVKEPSKYVLLILLKFLKILFVFYHRMHQRIKIEI